MIMEDAMTTGAHHQTDRATSPQRWPSLRPQPEPLPRAVTAGVSPKVSVSTVVAGLLGLAVAAANGLQANPALIAFLPPWAQWGALTLAPPLFVALAGYWAPAGDIYVPGDPGPIEPPAEEGEPAPVIDPNERSRVLPPPAEFGTFDPNVRPGPPYADPHNDLEDAGYDPDDDDPYWQRPDESDVDRDPSDSSLDTDRYIATPSDRGNGDPEDVDSIATEPGGMDTSGWPYEGGSHERGYPRNRR